MDSSGVNVSEPSTLVIPRHPDDVPLTVSDALLRAVLLDGQPAAAVGDADDVILYVHGLGHDTWDFAPMMTQHQGPVGARLQGRVLTLPGFGPGLLEKPPTAVVLNDLVDTLIQAARACPRPPVVCASSLGGHVALMAALRDPKLFSGLSLLSPGGLVDAQAATQAVIRRYYSVEAIRSRPEDEIIRNSRRIFVKPSPINDALAARKLCWYRASLANAERFAVPFASLVDDVLRCFIGGVVHQLKGLPMQVVFGEADVVVPLSSGRHLERACGATLHILRGVGHCAHLEDPETTWSLLKPFAVEAFARQAYTATPTNPTV
jgi:pimeloyl-ACP methyl ester carboxylesterase